MFSYVGLSFLILLHIVVIAILIPETSESIQYSGPIDIDYRKDEYCTANIRLEDPLKCMDKAEYRYTSTSDPAQTKILGEKIAHMDVRLRLLSSYSNSKAYIAFYTADKTVLESHILFSFHYSNLGGREKHECLDHCIIIFNITEVFKGFCKDNSTYKNVCCESNESSLPAVDPAQVSQNFLTTEREHGAKTNSDSTGKELDKIVIFPNEPIFYYTPGITYNFTCNASSSQHNKKLQMVLYNPNGNKINTLKSSNKTVLQNSFHIGNECNNSRIYCYINESIKSKEITLFLRDSFPTSTERLKASSAVFNNILSNDVMQSTDSTDSFQRSTERLEASSAVFNNTLSNDVMQSTDSTELSTSHGQEVAEEDSLKLLWYIGPILGVLCLSVGVLYFYCKRKKNNASRDIDIYTYTTQQQLMYAQLQLDSSMSHPVPRLYEGIPYTTIVGVLKPKQ